MDKLILEMAKQYTSLKENMSIFLQNSITPLQTSLEALDKACSRVAHHQTWEHHGRNLKKKKKLAKAETTFHKLET